MKLEPNMYIRDTRKGKIYKLTDFGLEFRPQKTTYDFEKASHNIIDLIEAGDYVNGKPVAEIYEDERCVTLDDNDKGWNTIVKENEIKTILTKEQFENNCYILQDEEVK